MRKKKRQKTVVNWNMGGNEMEDFGMIAARLETITQARPKKGPKHPTVAKIALPFRQTLSVHTVQSASRSHTAPIVHIP